MRSKLFVVLAALATGAGCASNTRQVDPIDTANAIGDDARPLPADLSAAPVSERDLTALRRPPAVLPVSDVSGLTAEVMSPARWDRYLSGDTTALSAAERRGLVLFTRAGCASCHDGLTIGGQKYRKLGEAIALRTLSDSGRYSATSDPADLFVFKVASLRNVELTPPYLHDGSIKTLGQTVRLMSRHQLGVDLTEDQVSDIRAYLTTLTGRVPFAVGQHPSGGTQ